MFPLGMVHFPHVGLPLRVFEPRYQELTNDCLASDGTFGVVLIQRGSEVGGGDVRYDTGTLTTIRDARVDDRGLIHLQTVGTRRVRVTEWLADSPYPRAVLTSVHEEACPSDALQSATALVRRALALTAELAEPAVPYNIELDPDPDRAVFQLAAIAPLGPADKQRLIEAPVSDLLRLLADFMEDELAVLAHRLAGH